MCARVQGVPSRAESSTGGTRAGEGAARADTAPSSSAPRWEQARRRAPALWPRRAGSSCAAPRRRCERPRAPREPVGDRAARDGELRIIRDCRARAAVRRENAASHLGEPLLERLRAEHATVEQHQVWEDRRFVVERSRERLPHHALVAREEGGDVLGDRRVRDVGQPELDQAHTPHVGALAERHPRHEAVDDQRLHARAGVAASCACRRSDSTRAENATDLVSGGAVSAPILAPRHCSTSCAKRVEGQAVLDDAPECHSIEGRARGPLPPPSMRWRNAMRVSRRRSRASPPG